MERLVGDLLDSTAIESGILRLQRHWCDIGLVVEAARVCVTDHESIRVHVGRGLEPVWADHDRLEQVLVNLFENAVSHGSSAGGVDVNVRRNDASGAAEIRVRDHGQGIEEQLLDRIFEPRFRAATDVSGAGLGLSIARGIVVAHGGTLVAAPVDQGALFVVALPLEPPDGASESPLDAAWTVLDEPEGPDG